MLNLEKDAANFRHILNELSEKLGWTDKDRTFRVLRAVLHTLRDSITLEESIHLMAQLPFYMKAVYAEGWKAHREDEVKPDSIGNFAVHVRDKIPRTVGYDLPNLKEAEETCRTVLDYLSSMVSEGEMKDIRAVLPKGLKELFGEGEPRPLESN